jgi:hypothetical protein
MRTIRFHDGHHMSWDSYRRLMKGEISPFKAVTETRRQPAVARARPQAPARRVWFGAAYDQAGGPGGPAMWDQTGGSLSRPFIDATNKFLADQGLSEEDCQAVSAILEKYAAVAGDEENLEMAPPSRVPVGGPRGPVGAADRRLALDELDMFGRPRRELVTAMLPGSESSGFSRRFPSATKIRVL